jgi:hypothetical protein
MEIDDFKLDYLVCKILHKTPAELGEIDEDQINFLKAGIIFEFDLMAKIGRPFGII